MVEDSSTRSYILASQRMFSRRGVPKAVLSDNAAIFKLGAKIVNADITNRACISESLTSFLANREIEFRYITPLTPWQGGVYERVVGLVKRLLYSTFGNLQLSYIELETKVIEMEGVVNSRPIVTNPTRAEEALALRPIDFLLPAVMLGYPADSVSSFYRKIDSATEQAMRHYLAALNNTLDKLWHEWSAVYLLELMDLCTK
uniref:Integrase catalytic domain-containing protein n=2 Tax=Caenorhabditis japonica TaxID=281687 RepID=A0A8R1DRZ2_CAEJA